MECNKDLNNIVFVILHYNVIEETKDCVESIKRNIRRDNIAIVVVDNCSPNKSGEVLKRTFAQDPMVSVLLMERNLGFACGNNAGILYAREKLNADFVCCMNNDTLIEQNDFIENLYEVYEEHKAAVIGPMVILKDGSIQQHPYRMYSVEEYQGQLRNWEKVLHPNLTYIIKSSLSDLSVVNTILNKITKRGHKTKVDNADYYLNEHEDIILHGCCLIFTPIFFERLDGFCPDTFLYNEEEILYLDLKSHDLHNVYSPKIQIRHMENAATDSVVKNNRERMEFLAKNKTQSLKILIEKLQVVENLTRG